MSSNSTGFINLLETVKKGILHFGSEKALEAEICAIMAKSDQKGRNIKYILDAVCKDFGINRETLMDTNQRKLGTEPRNLVYCILHIELGLSDRYIAKGVFTHGNYYKVWKAVKDFRESTSATKTEREFKERYERVWSKTKPLISL
jgi:chromosomal replication initiation ATPase DnaA